MSLAANPESEEPSRSSSPTIPFIILLAGLSAFGPISIDMYLPAFPAITKEFHAASGSAEITLAAFLVSAGIGQAVYGPLSDRFGRRLPLIAGCLLYILGAIWAAMAHSIPELTAARLLQGFGSSSGMVIGRAVVRDLYNQNEAARMFSLLMLIMGAAPILAPWMGGELLGFMSWRGIFVVTALFGLVILGKTFLFLPETLPPQRRTRGGAKTALHNFKTLLTDKNFLGYVLTAGFTSGILFSYISGSPTGLMKFYQLTPKQFSFLFAINASGLILASQINNFLLKRLEITQILKWVVACSSALGLALILVSASGLGGVTLLMVCLFFTLFSLGLTFPNIAAAALAPHGKMAGSASALIGAMQFLLGGCGGALVGLFNNGSAVPMCGVMAGAALCSFLSLHFLAFAKR